MLEFMLHGKVQTLTSFHKFNQFETSHADKKDLFKFIKCNDEYRLAEISHEALEEFEIALSWVTPVRGHEIEIVFRALPVDSPIRTSVLQTAI
jgi:hypothetical protein